MTIAAVIAFFGTVPVATTRWYLSPLLLVPVAAGVWSWRAGTDVTPAGLRIRALFGSRSVPWSHVAALVPADGRAYAVLTTGRRLRLTAVRAADLATLAPPGEAGGDRTATGDATPTGEAAEPHGDADQPQPAQ
jgi:Bacterial PH domain